MSLSKHGFLLKHSVQTNLYVYQNLLIDTRTSIDQGIQVDAIYTNSQKAFDKLNHSLLVLK